MTREKESKDFFDELSKYLLSEEQRLKKISYEHLKADREIFKDFEDMYKKIERGNGVACDRCGIPIAADNYGEALEAHSSEKTLKVICRECRIPYYGLGR